MRLQTPVFCCGHLGFLLMWPFGGFVTYICKNVLVGELERNEESNNEIKDKKKKEKRETQNNSLSSLFQIKESI